ncbi:hypothetical protein BpHYR1_051962 [Brachionus plicatilis]|uniref:Uncharacterized protein n=1 Tax=Brachionus plicatilis TaxID=10195 RepID=A0A3M7QRS9_BRAPC|nr:hypothetical protein BpHYR1_051962 [Brachionus plicatilis]
MSNKLIFNQSILRISYHYVIIIITVPRLTNRQIIIFQNSQAPNFLVCLDCPFQVLLFPYPATKSPFDKRPKTFGIEYTLINTNKIEKKKEKSLRKLKKNVKIDIFYLSKWKEIFKFRISYLKNPVKNKTRNTRKKCEHIIFKSMNFEKKTCSLSGC